MSFDLKIKGGDLSIVNGDFEKITNIDKLKQDILKICLTDIGSNPLATWYGSYASRTLIGNPVMDNVLDTIARNQLNNALEMLKKLQIEQAKTLQVMSPDEQIYSVQEVSVDRNKIDYRLVDIVIKVISRSFTRANVQFNI